MDVQMKAVDAEEDGDDDNPDPYQRSCESIDWADFKRKVI